MKRKILLSVAIIVFSFFTAWWIYLNLYVKSGDFQYQLFGGLYGLMALVGAVYGIGIALSWGGFKSLMGRSILMFSLGLLAQEVGQIIYSYYTIYKKVEVPYPSFGDIGFFGSILFYIYAIWLLGKASGIKVSLKSFGSKLQAIVIPLVMLGFSYFVFLKGYQFDWSNPLTIFLDFGYPFGEAIYISIALLTFLLSRTVLGGVMKFRVLLILMALLIQYIADFTFLYQSYNGAWSVGSVNDFMYFIAYFAMTLALLELSLSVVKNNLNNK